MKQDIKDCKKQLEELGAYLGDMNALVIYSSTGVVNINLSLFLTEITKKCENIYKTVEKLEKAGETNE